MEPQFDHEKLDVYQLALGFVAWSARLVEELEQSSAKKIGEVSNHLDRASLSILFNTAEGNGKRQRLSRGKFFDDARGSTTECAACLDALVAKGACTEGRIAEGKSLLVRIVAMLTKLVQRFSADDLLREEETDYTSETNHDN